MSAKPVLNAICQLLNFQDGCTISQIAGICGLKKALVLEVINRNGSMVVVDRKGKVMRVNTTSALIDRLWASGEFYRVSDYGMWCKEGEQLTLPKGHAMFEKLAESRTVGAFGDSGQWSGIIDTHENRLALESAGVRNWDLAVIDDRDWVE